MLRLFTSGLSAPCWSLRKSVVLVWVPVKLQHHLCVKEKLGREKKRKWEITFIFRLEVLSWLSLMRQTGLVNEPICIRDARDRNAFVTLRRVLRVQGEGEREREKEKERKGQRETELLTSWKKMSRVDVVISKISHSFSAAAFPCAGFLFLSNPSVLPSSMSFSIIPDSLSVCLSVGSVYLFLFRLG